MKILICALFLPFLPTVVFSHPTVTVVKDSTIQFSDGQTRIVAAGTEVEVTGVKDGKLIVIEGDKTGTIPVDSTDVMNRVTAAENEAKSKQREPSTNDVFSLGWFAPKVRVQNSHGVFSYTVQYTYSPELAGWNIAEYVYDAAKKRQDLTQITISCELGIDDLVDKYGNKVERPYIMGNVVVGDLDEVRRYANADAYAHQAQYWYGQEVRRLNYSEFLAKH